MPLGSLDRAEFVRALTTLTRRLHQKRKLILQDICKAAQRIEDGCSAREAAFDLATQHRELRVLGCLLQDPPKRRLDRLVFEGGLGTEEAREVGTLLMELARKTALLEALGWVMAPWFSADEFYKMVCEVSKPPSSSPSARFTKKPMALARDFVARMTLEQFSKAALADLVVDLIRKSEGNESLDGEALARVVVTEMEPVAKVRSDRVPRVPRVIKRKSRSPA